MSSLWFQIPMLIWIVTFMILSLRFSLQSRHGQQNHYRNRHTHGKLNMSMGGLLLGITVIQFSYYPEISSYRYGFIFLCLILGLFNLISGYRNWKAGKEEQSAQNS